ncbi:hypothetical protein C8R44DRAFT_866200 [Mycena epipterygia]|nr:hypothetical protein C8R44DRAFT_866200 [Mycena epipterygia]
MAAGASVLTPSHPSYYTAPTIRSACRSTASPHFSFFHVLHSSPCLRPPTLTTRLPPRPPPLLSLFALSPSFRPPSPPHSPSVRSHLSPRFLVLGSPSHTSSSAFPPPPPGPSSPSLLRPPLVSLSYPLLPCLPLLPSSCPSFPTLRLRPLTPACRPLSCPWLPFGRFCLPPSFSLISRSSPPRLCSPSLLRPPPVSVSVSSPTSRHHFSAPDPKRKPRIATGSAGVGLVSAARGEAVGGDEDAGFELVAAVLEVLSKLDSLL